MFADVEDPEVARLIAAAPDWPTLDELWTLAPPVPPPDDEWPDAPQCVGPAPFDMAPSGWLALDLDATTTDPRDLSDAQLVDAMAGFGRVASWAQARQARLVAEFDRRRPGSAARYAPDEVALALSVSRFSAAGLLQRSRRLVDTLHDTLAAYESGRVDGFKVRVICDAVRYLDDAQAEWVQDRVLDRAPHQSVAQLRAALARAVIAADTEGANARHRKARKDRRVGVGAEQDGMATVWASLVAQDAHQVFGTLTGLARSLGPDDPRGMDARRADLLVGLMTGEISIAFPTPDSAIPDTTSPDSATDSSSADSSSAESSSADNPSADNPSADGEHRDGDRSRTSREDRGDGRGDETGDDQADSRDGGGDDAGSDGGGGGEAAVDFAAVDVAAVDVAAVDVAAVDVAAVDVAAATADGAATGSCPACAAQAWRASRPRLRPVNPTKPLVQVLIAHSTLRGADHTPAELVGYGAICAEQAREIAADAVWRRLVYDDLTGAVLDHGRRTYRPPAALADHVRARDLHCRSPLCRRRAIDCELDHTVPFPHGPTAEPNLAAGCLLHHDEKHAPGWTVLQHPDGRIDWTTPTGHTYSSEIHDYRPPPPPPPPSIPGPIADHTDIQPAPPTARARTRRPAADWTNAVDRDGNDPAPF